MTTKHASECLLIDVGKLFKPNEAGYDSKSSKVEDEILQNSVRLTGIQQPLIVVQVDEEKYYVVDGLRRLRIALSLKIAALPCVVDHGVDDVLDKGEYRNRIRFILDEHRQDLLPTQRASLIRRLKDTFEMNSREVGLYLGVTSGTIANWMLIEKVIPEIQHAIDDGTFTIHASRAFAALSETGQQEIWDKHREIAMTMSAGPFHKWIRSEYPPTEHAEMYESPERVIQQLTRKETGRKAKKRTIVSEDKKSAMLKDFEAKKVEIEDKAAQIKSFEEDINAAIPIIEAILGDEELLEFVPESMYSDLEEFAKRFV